MLRRHTEKIGYCAIGSVKTNFGHLSIAAGVTGLIKTVLSLKHRQIPPSLHFERPNSQIDFANSPFYVNTTLTEWVASHSPRRAGVSSFGMGGTNVHIVLEEAPPISPPAAARSWQLLMLSAKTAAGLEQSTADLADHLKQTPDLNLADVAYTLQVGRPAFSHRRILVGQTVDQIAKRLGGEQPVGSNPMRSSSVGNGKESTVKSPSSVMGSQRRSGLFTPEDGWVDENLSSPTVAFMFSGQGAQYVNMGRDLYASEPTFRRFIDLGSEILKPHFGKDLRHILYPNPDQAETAAQQLKQTAITQPAIFLIEYALAQLWQEWGGTASGDDWPQHWGICGGYAGGGICL